MPDLTINGYKHHYEEVGDGPPMVFIAGTRFDAARDWVPYMREHAAGFRVVLPDPRGLAGSEHTTDVAPQDWVRDLGTLLEELGIDAVHLVSETLGTRIATRFAYEHPERVLSLVLNGVIAYSYAGGDDERRGQTEGMPADRLEQLTHYHGADALAVNDFYLDLHADPAFHEYYDLRKIAGEVRAPTLLLRGDVDDQRHPVQHSVDLHALLPDSRLAIFAGTPFNAMRHRPAESWALIRELTASASP